MFCSLSFNHYMKETMKDFFAFPLKIAFIGIFAIMAICISVAVITLGLYNLGIIPWSSMTLIMAMASPALSIAAIMTLFFHPYFTIKEESFRGEDGKQSFHEILEKATEELPLWIKKTMRWFGETFITTVKIVFLVKKILNAFYEKHYTARFRISYGLLCISLWLYTSPSASPLGQSIFGK
jgi:hypothetical protein